MSKNFEDFNDEIGGAGGAGQSFCPECGIELEENVCPQCDYAAGELKKEDEDFESNGFEVEEI